MKEDKKDLIFLCLSAAGICFTNLWPSILTYYSSFCYFKNPNTRVNQIYASYFFFMVGKLLGSVIYPYMFFVLGTSLMYFIFSLSEIFMGIFSQYNVTFFAASLLNLQKGLLFQGVMTAGNIILSEKFEKGILKNKYLTSTRMISSILGIFLCQLMVNPQNKPQDIITENDDHFFSNDIALNFQHFFFVFSIVCSILVLLPCLFIESPQNYKNKLVKYMNYLRGKDTFEFTINNNISTLSDISQSQSIILDNDKEKFVEKKLLENDDKQNKKIDGKFIHLLGIIAAINLGIILYCIQSYKYIALILNFKDFLISAFLSGALIFFIGAINLATFIWDKYGFDHTLVILNSFIMINLIGIISSRSFFILEVFLTRSCGGYLMIFQDLFCYSTFDSLSAMKYQKYFMFYNAIGNFYQILINFLFFDAQHYKSIFVLFSFLSLISFFIHFKFLKGKLIKQQN